MYKKLIDCSEHHKVSLYPSDRSKASAVTRRLQRRRVEKKHIVGIDDESAMVKIFFNLFLLVLAASSPTVRGASVKCEKTVTTASISGLKKSSGEKKVCSGDLIFEETFDSLDLDVWQHDITLNGNRVSAESTLRMAVGKPFVECRKIFPCAFSPFFAGW